VKEGRRNEARSGVDLLFDGSQEDMLNENQQVRGICNGEGERMWWPRVRVRQGGWEWRVASGCCSRELLLLYV
jgi:hypothetical protein